MSAHVSGRPGSGRARFGRKAVLFALAGVIIVGVGVIVAAFQATGGAIRPGAIQTRISSGMTGSDLAQDIPHEERVRIYRAALSEAEALAGSWPATEPELIRAFWEAVSLHDFDRMVLYAPGSVREDFKALETFTPGGLRKVGRPEPHPRDPEITLWPAQVPFPMFPNKTVKMAIRRLDDGRLIIDGGKTIWW